MTAGGFHVTKCCITEEFWYSSYQSLLIPFLVSSSFNITSLIVWKEGWGSTPTFLWVSSTVKLSDLVTFFHSFLTMGCNYLIRVPVYSGLTSLTPFSPSTCTAVSCSWIITCSSAHSPSLTASLSDQSTSWLTDWLTDRHSALFFLVKVKL